MLNRGYRANCIEARHDILNIYFGKVMKKCGLKYEGTLREAGRNMKLKDLLRGFRHRYIENHAKDIEIPKFERSNIIRRNIVFSGKVQNVGFRLELYLVATKIGLTGWVKNRDDGKVEAEIQGEKEFVVVYD
ncbi:acylphosphatase [Clostridium sp. AL.422]|uniref:acylphosphatase n=1 Tax=Clostridium TaxID=1485 RepID=UPI00293DC0D0|nr:MULTISPECIES: acylphosphatase [unclassified Clostridium]MDV4149288.1 acylphosphatase [Clostridium sp. AL.422]